MAGVSVSETMTSRSIGFYRDHCIFLPSMLGWFLFSSLLSTYNKFVFGENHLAFPFPLLMTSFHFLIQWVVAYVLSSIPAWSEPLGGNQIKEMTWKDFLKASLPCGIVTALDVGFSNLSIARISVTLYTMLKASSPVFVVASAFLFKLEPVSIELIVVVLIIACGEFLTVYGEEEETFDMLGAIFCLLASMCSGMRWTVIQFFIQSLDPPLKTAIATMRLVSPCMFIFMLGFSFAIERPIQKLANGDEESSIFFDSVEHTFRTVGIASIGGALAVSMILCELFLIMKSSAITLMVGGVIKELCTICAGVLVFHDKLNAINVLGFFIVFLGVLLYKVVFHIRSLQKKEQQGAVLQNEVEGDEVVSLENVNGDNNDATSWDPDDDGDAHIANGKAESNGSHQKTEDGVKSTKRTKKGYTFLQVLDNEVELA